MKSIFDPMVLNGLQLKNRLWRVVSDVDSENQSLLSKDERQIRRGDGG